MRPSESRPYLRGLLLLVGLLFLYREWVTVSVPITLFYDEAYYLSWAQTPDWGYFSKPPVVAWLIALTTGLFGTAEWAVKLGAPLLYGLSTLLIYGIGHRLLSRESGFFAALIFLLAPLVSFNSLFITTDAPLLFFWSAALYAFVRAQASNGWGWWLLAALCGGLGLLSKYTFILLPAGFLLFALLSAQGRALLRNPRFWVACLLALACLLPNLYWNYQHAFISFQHTAEISQQGKRALSPERLLEFWVGQALVIGPLFALLLVAAAGRWAKRRRAVGEGVIWLWCMFLPVFLTLSLQALLARANINWAAPAYVAGALLVGHYLTQLKHPKRWLLCGLALNAVLMVGFYHYTALTERLGIERRAGNDPYKRLLGWPQLVERLQPVFTRYPELPLASHSRKLLAYFGYYLQPHRFDGRALDLNGRIDDQYELTRPVHGDGEFLFVIEGRDDAQLQRYFERVQWLATESVDVYRGLRLSASVYRVGGVKPEHDR